MIGAHIVRVLPTGIAYRRQHATGNEMLRELLHTYLESVERPAAKLEEARLLVKGEELHVNLAGGLEDGRRRPHHAPVVVEDCLGHRRHDVLAVGAKKDYWSHCTCADLTFDVFHEMNMNWRIECLMLQPPYT